MHSRREICLRAESVSLPLEWWGYALTYLPAVDYGASVIVAKAGSAADQGDGTDVSVSSDHRITSKQDLAKGILVGKRMPSVKVLNQSDARPWQFQELLPSNGQYDKRNETSASVIYCCTDPPHRSMESGHFHR